MSKRYYLADIIGDGTDEGGDFRAATSDYPVGTTGEMPANPTTGKPLNTWMLIEVFVGDVAVLAGDPRIDPLPDVPLSAPLAQIDPAQLSSMRVVLTRRGIGAGIVDTALAFGDVLAGIALRANAGAVTTAAAQLEL